MSRPKTQLHIVDKLAQAFKAVGKLKRNGTNTTRRYKYPRATDVFEAVRLELFNRGVIILPDEGKPEYVDAGPSNGGEKITECRLPVAYRLRDAQTELGPITVNGIGRDVEDKSLYKAQTGAQKALLKRLGLMAEEVDDPEWDSRGDEDNPSESLDDVAPMRVPSSQKPVTPLQISAFQDACAASGKTPDEISHYLAGEHKVDAIEKLKRGKPFTAAIRWASDGKGTLAAPKPQAVPSQGSLALRTAPKPVELKIGNKTVEISEQKGAFAL